MKNYIEWRPHHSLCMERYVGIGYNKAHKNIWDRVSKLLKRHPDIKVKITMAEDTLCTSCPNHPKLHGVCSTNYIKSLDEKVRSLLGLKEGMIYKYNEISKKLSEILNPKKHSEICGDCSWKIHGICKDTFKKADS